MNTPHDTLLRALECRTRTPLVLVVDDTASICTTVKYTIADYDCEVRCAYSGEECLRMLHEDNYRLIFLDMVLPDMHGSELLPEIRKLDRDVPIAVLTGYPDELLFRTLRSHGIIFILEKPANVTRDNFVEVLRYVNIKARRKIE